MGTVPGKDPLGLVAMMASEEAVEARGEQEEETHFPPWLVLLELGWLKNK